MRYAAKMIVLCYEFYFSTNTLSLKFFVRFTANFTLSMHRELIQQSKPKYNTKLKARQEAKNQAISLLIWSLEPELWLVKQGAFLGHPVDIRSLKD